MQTTGLCFLSNLIMVLRLGLTKMAILTERRIENMKRIILSCLSLLMLFSMLTPWKTSAKSKSKLNKTSITMYTGTKVKLKLKGTKKKCKWSVNKPQIISVSQKGIVKAKKKGKAKVLQNQEKKYICKDNSKSQKEQTDKSNSGNKFNTGHFNKYKHQHK